MGAAAFLLPGIVGAYGALQAKKSKQNTDYPEVPSIFDPSVYAAGDTARRRAGATSGQAMGQTWSAEKFVTSMPMLMGK